jgi:AraC-like DNA-binding protein
MRMETPVRTQAMLASYQRLANERVGLHRLFHGAFHPRMWVHIVENRGCISDDRVAACLSVGRPPKGRRLLGLRLRGLGRVRVGETEHWGGPGTVYAADGRAGFATRDESPDGPSLSLNIDWDREYFGSRSVGGLLVGKLSNVPQLVAECEDLREAIEAAWVDPSADARMANAAAGLCSVLRAEGYDVPAVRAAELRGGSSPQVEALSRALDMALCMTDERPAQVDLEERVGMSARTLRRQLPRVLDAWGLQTETFTELRTRIRLFQATLLMSNPNATTELGAQTFGFSSPTAFCRSFLLRGLASPGRIREALVAVR